MLSRIELAQKLAASRYGLSMEDMVKLTDVTRNTIYNWFAEIEIEFPQYTLTRAWDEKHIKRWRLQSVPHSRRKTGRRALGPISPSEVTVLRQAIDKLKGENIHPKVAILDQLYMKITAELSTREFNALEAQESSILRAGGFAVRPGFKVRVSEQAVETIKNGIIECRRVRITYTRGERQELTVSPYGFLYYDLPYLVSTVAGESPESIRLFRLSSISNADSTEEPFDPIPGFDVRDYASTAIGPYHHEPMNVVLKFSPEIKDEIAIFEFHPDEIREVEEDGSTIVQFTASGDEAIGNHLFPWGDNVQILHPESLRTSFLARLEAIQNRYSSSIEPWRTQ